MPPTTPPPTGHLRWLALTATAYAITHHTGVATAALGTIGPTRWADWIDLLTPYAVLPPAALALHATRPTRRVWALYLIAALTYTEGHGIHLAANSIHNTAPGPTAHLWDEPAGHYLWYTGAALLLATLTTAFTRQPPPHGTARHLLGHALALAAGLTWATNTLEGGTAPLGLAVAAALTVHGWTTRAHLGRLWLTAFAPALLILIAWGLHHGGYPQPSTLGWI
ncbi:hypothetical protein GCM10009678_01190 [Actinomadura kijaniata]|uniref:Uncharacterized protein n=1 Tax=Actinomadura namibiensis TaxID=182080 RepID=A0A7W3QN99_ACTNM|nr:hypothetical protein [Actinomadura namibiensis]MBA8953354.1 hypothetical protein [Actinomadura namibiensis]